MSAAPAPLPPSNRNPTYLIVAGIVVSLLGAIIVIVLVSRPSNITVAGITKPVVVAAHPLDAHAQIRADDLTIVQYPVDLVPNHSFTTTDAAAGRFTVAALAKGQPLTDELVAGTAQSAASAGGGPPTGEVAVVIPPSDARSLVAPLVQNGDHVDILARGLPGQGGGQVAVTFTNLAIQVLSAGGPSSNASGQWVVYLPLDKAAQLVYLLNSSQYTFVVRSRQDTTDSGSAPAVGRNEFNSAYNIH